MYPIYDFVFCCPIVVVVVVVALVAPFASLFLFRVCPVSVSVKESPPNPEEVKPKTTQIPINRKCCVHLPDKHIQKYIYIIHVNIYCIYTQS